jgi:hypothetical protein
MNKLVLFELQESVRSFIGLDHWSSPFAATLTLRQARYELNERGASVRVPLTDERASRNFRHFINLLSSRVYGKKAKRFGRKVRAFPVQEGGRHQRLHYHAVIECPREDLTSIYPQLIEQCWQRTDWGYDQVHVTADADPGWLRYMTKLRSKPDFGSSIDWMNYAN